MKSKLFRTKMAIASLATMVALCCACGSSAQQPQKYRSESVRRELELAKIDFRALRLDSAEAHLKKALAQDDTFNDARMGLAVVYAMQYTPGDSSPENMIFLKMAVDTFQDLVARDPKNSVALKSLGALYYIGMRKFPEAREFYLKATIANPNDAEAFYGVGVTDWGATYLDSEKRKSEIVLDADEAFRNTPRDQKVCMDLKAANESRVEDGLKNLTLAMEKRKDYSDAMSFMSLLYQRKADIECGNRTARVKDLNLAGDFAGNAAVIRNRAQQQPSGNVPGQDAQTGDLDFSKLAEQFISHLPPPSAPPPPPPPPPVRH
jgi:Tfp pilus assembly protein PilF